MANSAVAPPCVNSSCQEIFSSDGKCACWLWEVGINVISKTIAIWMQRKVFEPTCAAQMLCQRAYMHYFLSVCLDSIKLVKIFLAMQPRMFCHQERVGWRRRSNFTLRVHGSTRRTVIFITPSLKDPDHSLWRPTNTSQQCLVSNIP